MFLLKKGVDIYTYLDEYFFPHIFRAYIFAYPVCEAGKLIAKVLGGHLVL